MRKILFFLYLLPVTCYLLPASAADEKFLSCGPGFVLASISKIEGITAYECQKLWCRDLETGKPMGDGNAAASGYKATGGPVELCDANNTCIQCFGDRKWCAGETAGAWNPDFGAYTRGGGDNSSYISYLKSSCFGWRLEKPNCPEGQAAILKGGAWVCATASGSAAGTRAAAIRRTAVAPIRRVIR